MVADAPPDRGLSFGTVGTVSYTLSLAQGVLVPVSALQNNENKDFVFAVQGGKAVQQPITVAAETGTTAAVAGIETGTQVIVNPPPGLLAGSSVRVVEAQPAAPAGAAGAQGTQNAQGAQGGPAARSGQKAAGAAAGATTQGQGAQP